MSGTTNAVDGERESPALSTIANPWRPSRTDRLRAQLGNFGKRRCATQQGVLETLQRAVFAFRLDVHFARVIQDEPGEPELLSQTMYERTKAHALHQTGDDERTSLDIAGWHCGSVHERDDVAPALMSDTRAA